MSQRGQFLAYRFRNQLFDADVTALERPFREAARLQRFLNIESVVRNVRDELGMRLRLVEAAHDSESNPHAVLLHKGGNDRVQWTLARSQRVRMVWLQRE